MAYDGSIRIDTKVDTASAEKDIDSLKSLAEKGASAAAVSVAAIGAAAAAGIGAAVKVGMDFESSMSQVAATMGITASEIQSGSKDFTMLSDAAKKCGEETQFSASQAAEGLNYLALAGYDAQKATAALPTVLNLAAAGGLDLGYASDMVTDSMSALGLEMDDLNGFVDQMAKTSQKSNTSVGQLGEAILTVGGTAKMLSGGTVELNTQLGILADNGIKGSEGGTALRNVILSLSAPTDTAAKQMKALGFSAFDANGKMKPLNEVFLDLNDRLSSLSDEKKTQALNTIFNKVDLKSVNALLGTSAERFEELSTQIKNSSGAAADMAETMNDNLKGQITILGSALEGLGIQIYESIDEPMKEAVKGAINAVGEFTASLKDGELSGAIGNVGRLLGELINAVVKAASVVVPALINTIGFLGQNINVILPTVLTFVGVIKSYEIAATAARATQKLLNTAMMLNPATLAVAALAALTVGVFAYAMANETATDCTIKLSDEYVNLFDTVSSQKKAYDDLKAAQEEEAGAKLAQIDYVQRLYSELETLTDETAKVEDADRSRASFIVEQVNKIIPDALTMTDNQITKNKELQGSIYDVLNAERAKVILAAEEKAYEEAVQNVSDAQSVQAQTAVRLAAVKAVYDLINDKTANKGDVIMIRPDILSWGTQTKISDDAQESVHYFFWVDTAYSVDTIICNNIEYEVRENDSSSALENGNLYVINLKTAYGRDNSGNYTTDYYCGIISKTELHTHANKSVLDAISKIDTSPVSSSSDLVTSGGVYTALSGKSDTGHTHTKSDITDFPTSMTPTSHASTSTTYGTGNSSSYGHLKLSDSTSSTSSTSGGIAATPKAVKAAYDKANIVKNSSSTSGDIISGHLTVGTRVSGSTYGSYSFTSGEEQTASGSRAVVVGGYKNTAGDMYSAVISGYSNTANGSYSIIISGSNNNTARGTEQATIISGEYNTVSGNYGVSLGGYYNTVLEAQVKMGHFAKDGTAGTYTSGTGGDAFIIGNGTATTKSNAFRVQYAGGVFGKAAYNSQGADYAEMWEWADGNPDNEDRRGLFAYIENNKMRLASSEDTDRRRLGIISATPAVVGDNYSDDWKGKYLTDIFGKVLTQSVHHDAEYDDEGNVIREAYEADEPILSPDYDPKKEYVSRENRREYGYWSFIGKLITVDDGTCFAGGYCYPSDMGIATNCDDVDKGFYVMERLDETHIRVLVK